MEKIHDRFAQVKEELAKIIVGQQETVDGILMALVVGGHLLLEGPPGVAKTLLAKTLAGTLAADFKRVQFTPDLMPLDVTGANIFDFQKQQFNFIPGPIFTDILLADEINRTPPKTQAALLEAMEEKQVTVDGKRKPLSPIFTVIATQNPIEYEGTYPLPEAQLDRFLFKLIVSYPSPEEEIEIYQRFQGGLIKSSAIEAIPAVLTRNELLDARESLRTISIRTELIAYIQQIIKSTREHPLLQLGASPRAGVYLLLGAKAYALMQGRDYVTPDDIQAIAYPVLRHRLIVKPEAQVDGKTSDMIIRSLLNSLKVPR
jgi:MoxR-like ATPase